MNLRSFDNQAVRLTTRDGDVFDGVAVWNSADYGEAELGKNEESLEIDSWVFYRSDIRAVEALSGKARFWMGKTQHGMHLDPSVFALTEQGEKTTELRVYDDKRKLIRVGDILRFEDRSDDTEVLYARVTGLRTFPSFAQAYEALGPESLRGCPATPDGMAQYYSAQQQAQYGVAAIRFALL